MEPCLCKTCHACVSVGVCRREILFMYTFLRESRDECAWVSVCGSVRLSLKVCVCVCERV